MALIDKSSPRESRSEFLPRTHPIQSIIYKNHVLGRFELFHSGHKHRTRVCQNMPILALIDKSSPRESRSEFLPRTHPIHSNMSKNHVLLLFELFHSGQKHRIHVCPLCESWHFLTKDRRANHEVIFFLERTQYTPICPKIMFCCFSNFFIPIKNIAPVCAKIC